MKYLIILITLTFVSCASVKYKDFSYSRIGKQNLKDVTLKFKEGPDGKEVEASLGRQQSGDELEKIMEILSNTLRQLETLK